MPLALTNLEAIADLEQPSCLHSYFELDEDILKIPRHNSAIPDNTARKTERTKAVTRTSI